MANLDNISIGRKKYSKDLFLTFFFLTFVLTGGLCFVTIRALDVGSLLFAAKQILPPSFIIGYLGYLIGKIIEMPRRGKAKNIQKVKY